MNSLSSFLRSVVLVGTGVFCFAGSIAAQNLDNINVCALDQMDFSYFIPSEAKFFNKEILSPDVFFGVKTAQSHLSYEMVYSYLSYLERASNRVKLEVLGRTYEAKPFVCATISSAYNIENLDIIQEAHLKEIEGLGSAQVEGLAESGASGLARAGGLPVVNWLGYSVHGNEASGINASVVVAYVLAACEDEYVKEILDNSIVLLLPALNPDGATRYATWVNSNLSFAKNNDALGRESREPAPSSRSNHYWFDLNRDWLLAVHPEGRAILKGLHSWQPAIVSDFHEHGSATGTFFSPGIKSSTNKVIYPPNWDVTNKIATFHRNYMEDIGTLYFSGEGYDDFYPGKGGCYPDLLGAIGILYEQPSSRGLNRMREGVDVSLAVSVRNQVFCSFSALIAGVSMKEELRDYRRNYLKWRQEMYAQFKGKAYIFTTGEDLSMTREFINLLDAHNIKYSIAEADFYVSGSAMDGGSKANGQLYSAGKSIVVPLEQSSISVIRTLFETEKEFKDSTFYDISTWTAALAYNLQYSLVSLPVGYSNDFSSNRAYPLELPLVPSRAGHAYLFEMNDFYSYNFLYYLLDKGVYLKAADSAFSFDIGQGVIKFANGTVMIPVKLQNFSEQQLYHIISNYFTNAENFYSAGEAFSRGFIEKGLVKIYAVNQGVGVEFDLGSPRFRWISKPSIAILVGPSASYSSIGELWHLLDFKFRVPVTLLDYSLVNSANLSNYNVVIIADNLRFTEESTQDLTRWAAKNTLIAIGDGVQFARKNKLTDITFHSLGTGSFRYDSLDSVAVSYAYRLANGRFNPFNGVILESIVDLTHPLAIGVKKSALPVFKRSSLVVEQASNPFSVFSRIRTISAQQTPLMSGYITPHVLKVVSGSPYIISQRGLVLFPDTPYFRGYWMGTSRLLMNAVFFREFL